MKEPSVTVVTPCFNGRQFLNDCFASLRSQTYEDWEWIIVDDGSNDGSLRLCRELTEKDGRIRVYTTGGRKGAATARNIAISRARGRFIAFLDCDDIWRPEKLETQLGHMTQRRLAFCWSSYDIIDERGNYLRTERSPSHCTYKDLLTKRAVIGCLTAVYDQKLFGQQLMPQLRLRQDYALFLRLLRIAEEQGLRVSGLTQTLASYRVHKRGMTSNKLRAARYQWKLYREIEHLSLTESMSCFVSYFAHGVSARLFPTKQSNPLPVASEADSYFGNREKVSSAKKEDVPNSPKLASFGHYPEENGADEERVEVRS